MKNNKYKYYLRLILIVFVMLIPAQMTFAEAMDSLSTKARIVVRVNSVAVDSISTIPQTESAHSRMEYLDVICNHKGDILFLILLLSSIIMLIIIVLRKQIDEKKNLVTILLSLIIILLSLLANHWTCYLATMILMAFYLVQGKTEWYNKVTELLSIIWHYPIPMTEQAIKENASKEVEEEVLESGALPTTDTKLELQTTAHTERQKTSRERIDEYIKVEQLALAYIGREFPALQRNVVVGSKYNRFECDGYIKGDNVDIIVEVKYFSTPHPIQMQIFGKLLSTAQQLGESIKKEINIKLVIVVQDEGVQHIMNERYLKAIDSRFARIIQILCLTKKDIGFEDEA